MARPLFLFAPGAGAPSTSAWMERWAERLGSLGIVQRFDYPYRLAGRRAPDRLPILIQAHVDALSRARGEHGARPVVLAGKSMGSRIGCHVALVQHVDALVCFGYPLRGAGKRAPIRDAVLLQLHTPVLFVQGTRDPLCPLDLLEETRARMTARTALHVVDGGDHSLEPTARDLRASGLTQDAIDDAIRDAVSAFVRDQVGTRS